MKRRVSAYTFTENPAAENGQSDVTAEHGLEAAYRKGNLRLRRERPLLRYALDGSFIVEPEN